MRTRPIAETPDARLVASVLGGDLAAYGHLVRRHAPIAKRMAVLWGAADEADDVVQEAFIRAYQALPRFRAGEEFRPWLLTIVRRLTLNSRRARGRRTTRESFADLRWPVTDVADEAIDAARRDQLLACVRRLPEELREVVVCRYLLELSEKETAATLGLRPGTVKSRLHRALLRLRTEVTDD
ncbi:MAG TPA: RNA polymerase sigma factor [Microlunatus sp.]|jgi:RNA polymerase sigma factor (sigma-70 family)|nr:RNA polymerase sigma factor [Microlunatus sp.]